MAPLYHQPQDLHQRRYVCLIHLEPSSQFASLHRISSVRVPKADTVAHLVLTREDAEDALSAGVDGIFVSNHGGRQLDSVVTTAQVLPEIVSAVRGRVPVHVDGGIRNGGDIFKVRRYLFLLMKLSMSHASGIIGSRPWR